MNVTDYQNSAEAIGAARANLSPRQRELENLERYARGTQYDGRPNFFDPSVPLWDRAPCVVYPVVKIAIESNVDLVLGEARFPEITSNPGEDDSDVEGLNKEDSLKVDRAILELTKRVRFRSVSRKALKHAQAARSVAGIVGTRSGKPFVELVRSRWCEPTFGNQGEVTKLEIRYPYLKPEKQHDGTWKLIALLYRRVIDTKSDTTYQPVPADQQGREPQQDAWVVDEAKTVHHKLGFCPVHWYPHDPECSTVADFDGEAIHEEVLDEIQALDLTLSQRHRSALFCGDPQIIETGVERGYNPSGATGAISVPATASGGTPSAANPVTARYESSGPKQGRIKSPGGVWQYEDTNVNVDYLVLPPGSLEALENNGADLRNKIAEALAVVLIDPQNAKFTSDMSGRAVEMLRSRQFDRCDQIRDDVGDNWVLPVVKLLLRVALKTNLKIPAVVAVRELLARFVSDDGDALMLTLRWPTGYVKPSPKDESDTTVSVVAARSAKLITKRSAVQKLAPFYGVSNVDQALEELLKEEESDKQEAAANQAAAAEALDARAGDDASKDGAPPRPPPRDPPIEVTT